MTLTPSFSSTDREPSPTLISPPNKPKPGHHPTSPTMAPKPGALVMPPISHSIPSIISLHTSLSSPGSRQPTARLTQFSVKRPPVLSLNINWLWSGTIGRKYSWGMCATSRIKRRFWLLGAFGIKNGLLADKVGFYKTVPGPAFTLRKFSAAVIDGVVLLNTYRYLMLLYRCRVALFTISSLPHQP